MLSPEFVHKVKTRNQLQQSRLKHLYPDHSKIASIWELDKGKVYFKSLGGETIDSEDCAKYLVPETGHPLFDNVPLYIPGSFVILKEDGDISTCVIGSIRDFIENTETYLTKVELVERDSSLTRGTKPSLLTLGMKTFINTLSSEVARGTYETWSSQFEIVESGSVEAEILLSFVKYPSADAGSECDCLLRFIIYFIYTNLYGIENKNWDEAIKKSPERIIGLSIRCWCGKAFSPNVAYLLRGNLYTYLIYFS